MKKCFKFVYSFAIGEIPEARHFKANNLTNARNQWDEFKDPEDTLLAIFDGDQEIWRSDIETGFSLEAIH